ncbi:hypothetical protein, partial [Nocardioides sp. P5_C9_2]
MIRRRRARRLAAVCVALATMTLGACGDGNESESTDAATICEDVDAIRTSVADITEVTIDADALTQLQDNLDQVRDDVSTLINDARDEFADEVDAVDQAVSGVTTTLRTAVNDPTIDTLSALRTQRKVLTDAVTDLADAV